MNAIPEVLRSALADRYRIERPLGQGGMATVYLAHDLRHDRPVALKLLHPELAHSLGPERFLREIKTAARLQHPHILTVLDSGEHTGHLWFTMPFVDGRTLRERLNQERQLAVDEAVRIATEVGRALDHAHRHGIIHRDIKPENILLTTEGDTLVADFGIARALGGQEQQLTETGMAVGTPAYMSPEQATGERGLDARTDVYALGSVLYEMLAGEAPFTGPTAQAVIAKRMRGEVPQVRTVRPNVPPLIEAAITRALAPVPADRYPSAGELTRALASVSSMTLGAVTTALPARRRVPAGLALLLVGFLVGAGVLLAWRKGSASSAPRARTIAVLPFDNQGDSTQDFFADGITDEVRGKLTVLPGVVVIASNSSRAYRNSDKPLAQVAGELGADYLLMAKVRWARASDGSTQVRVSPELVAVSGGTPTTRWQQGFDAALTDVFQVQTDIAEQVAQALGLALADSLTRKLAAQPTTNLRAYEAYLHGEQHLFGKGNYEPKTLRAASAHYEQAIALDSAFSLAWSRLARARSLLYANGLPDPATAEQAHRAAERAMALAPNTVHGHLAMAAYHRDIRSDYESARREMLKALAVEPRNAEVVAGLAGLEGALGRWDSAVVHAREATRLDPRALVPAERLGNALRKLGRYREARAELDRARAFAPSALALLQDRVMVELRAGDMDSARAVVRAATAVVPAEMVAHFANSWDLYWVLDDAEQRLLLTLPPESFDDDRASWAIVRTQTHWLRGDSALARAYADSARLANLEILKVAPRDAQRLIFLGLSYAFLGQRQEAVRYAERGLALMDGVVDHQTSPYFQHLLARIHTLTGEPDKAIDILERLLKVPYELTPASLRIDPNFAPLKGHPRFEKLIAVR